MEDEKIIGLYWDRKEEAIQETSSKYGKLCFFIARNILASSEDSEECVNDAYLGVWNAIPKQRPSRFSVFVSRITRNLALKKYEYRIVINTTTPTASATNVSSEIANYSANVEEVIRLNAIITSNTGQKTVAPYYYSDDDRVWMAYNPPNYNNVALRNSVRMMVGPSLVKRPAIVILEYTKTTDQAT